MDYTNFEIGQQFPLPIKAAGDGGLFQIDANGIMFILRLSNADIIAVEAFRTGKMELALYEEDGLLFFLYQIDGIFKEGWGDAPFSLSSLKKELLPSIEKLSDKTIHLYLVDSRLNTLLALRRVTLNDDFFAQLKHHTEIALNNPLSEADHFSKVQKIWQKMTSAAMRNKAVAVQEIPLDIVMPDRKTN